jgi:hypothetical protein
MFAFATLINFGKAIHIDDAAHMYFAQWIAQNPLHPMLGQIYEGGLTSIHQTNQPHLYFYLMALTGVLFGWSEYAMHGLMAIFCAWAISACYRLCNHFLSRNHALFATTLIILSPAFVVNQNTMVDIPQLAIWLEFYQVLCNPHLSAKRKYVFAALLCSSALLIKYTAIILLPALVICAVLERRLSMAWALAFPIAVLALWSAFNYYDYGHFHILDRTVGTNSLLRKLRQFFFFMGVLGAILPFLYLVFWSKSRTAKSYLGIFMWCAIALFAALPLTFVAYSPMLDEESNSLNLWFNTAFLISGIATFCLCVQWLLSQARVSWSNRQSQQPRYELLLAYWFFSVIFFMSFAAPFMATRHVLLVIAPVVILVLPYFFLHALTTQVRSIICTLALGSTLGLTLLIASADIWHAHTNRMVVQEVKRHISESATTDKIWFVGMHGLNWYAQLEGFRPFTVSLQNKQHERPHAGEFLVVQKAFFSHKDVNFPISLHSTITVERKSWYQKYAHIGFYTSDMRPWSFHTKPLSEIQIYRVLE